MDASLRQHGGCCHQRRHQVLYNDGDGLYQLRYGCDQAVAQGQQYGEGGTQEGGQCVRPREGVYDLENGGKLYAYGNEDYTKYAYDTVLKWQTAKTDGLILEYDGKLYEGYGQGCRGDGGQVVE